MTNNLTIEPYDWSEDEELSEINIEEMEAVSDTNIFIFSLYASRTNSISLGDYFNPPEINYGDIFAEITNFEALDLNYQKVNITEEQKEQVIKEIIYEIK